MYLEIKKINSKDIKIAEKYFWNNFCEKLRKEKPWTYKESLVARYLLSPFLNKEGIKEWSISHKKDLVFIWTSENKIWVDIEIFKIRDKNLLNKFNKEEYNILSWNKTQRAKALCWKAINFENFYILWTGKESIIKYENLILDNIEEILLKKIENINLEISWIKFNKKLFLEFWGKIFEVISGRDRDIFYSVCFWNFE